MRRTVIVALAAAALVSATQAVADPPQRARTEHRRVVHHSARYRAMHAAWRLCSNRRPTACVRYAALKHYQPYSDALRVARCESTMNPYASNGTHFGLYQFLASTWGTTPYARRSYWRARWNALAAMWMWRVGRRGEWACG